MEGQGKPSDLDRLARLVALWDGKDPLLGARAARALGAQRLLAPYLSDLDAARALVAETAEGGDVERVERIELGGEVGWRAILRNGDDRLFVPGIFGFARSPAQAVVAAALRRAACSKGGRPQAQA